MAERRVVVKACAGRYRASSKGGRRALFDEFVAMTGYLDPGVVTAAQMSLGGLPLLLIGLAVEGNPARLHWTLTAVLSLLYLALVGSSLAFVLWYRLLKTTEVTRAQVIPLLNTVVAVILGWLVLGETFGVRGAVGTLAVLAGTALVLRRSPQTAA